MALTKTHARGDWSTSSSSIGKFFGRGVGTTPIGWKVRYPWERLCTVELRRGGKCYLGILLRSVSGHCHRFISKQTRTSHHPMAFLPTIHTRGDLRARCWAHPSNGLAANGVLLLAVVTGGVSAFTVSLVATFRCNTTGLPLPHQPCARTKPPGF